MTVKEAVQRTQDKGAGAINLLSVRYAQTLISPDEAVAAAVVANVTTKSEHFPGVVVLTDQRVMAVCGLPGIKRTISLPLDRLEQCKEAPTAIHYKATFSGADKAFSLTVDPETGERFSRHIAILNGEVDAFDAVDAGSDGSIFNPVLMRSKLRVRQAKEKAQAERTAQMEAACNRCRETQLRQDTPIAAGESTQAVAQRLAQQLAEAKAAGQVDDTDPKAVAARLAAELAAEEAKRDVSG